MARRYEQDHPFYKPLWRRVVIVIVVALWAAFEFYMGQRGLWLWIAIGALAYAVYTFLLTFPKDDPPAQGGPPS
jgi:hypothetical protein